MDKAGVANVKKAAEMIRDGLSHLSGGGLDYYLRELCAAYDYLIANHAPFVPGQRVTLNYTPTINEKTSWGWIGSKHFLVEGALATIKEARFGSSGWSVDVEFDDDSWIHPTTKGRMYREPTERHLYRFSASHFDPT